MDLVANFAGECGRSFVREGNGYRFHFTCSSGIDSYVVPGEWLVRDEDGLRGYSNPLFETTFAEIATNG